MFFKLIEEHRLIRGSGLQPRIKMIAAASRSHRPNTCSFQITGYLKMCESTPRNEKTINTSLPDCIIKIDSEVGEFKLSYRLLLSISGVDTIGIPEIYEKYLTFSGKN